MYISAAVKIEDWRLKIEEWGDGASASCDLRVMTISAPAMRINNNKSASRYRV